MKANSTGHVFYRNFNWPVPTISHGDGIYLYDTKGRQYLDSSGGAYVASLGHGVAEISNKIAVQLAKVSYINGFQFTSEAMEKVADRLFHLSREHFSRFFILSSGSEAIEAAVKLARQCQVVRGKEKKNKIISRIPSYHGNTVFALSLSARPSYKKAFSPYLYTPLTLSTPYPYRSPVDAYSQDGAAFYLAELEDLIRKEDPETIAAIVLEPISGSSLGAALPPPYYLERLGEMCRRHGIITIADEVLVGSGRTGDFFASQHFNFKPDIAVLGKSINAGFVPASVVCCTEEIAATLEDAGQNILHAQTYMQHIGGAAAVLAVLEYMENHDLLTNVRRFGVDFHEMLKKEIAPLKYVGICNGLGFLAGIEIVEDKNTKKPFAATLGLHEKIRRRAFEKGLIVWVQGGHLPDGSGDLVMLAPPFICGPEQLSSIVTKLKSVLQEMTQMV